MIFAHVFNFEKFLGMYGVHRPGGEAQCEQNVQSVRHSAALVSTVKKDKSKRRGPTDVVRRDHTLQCPPRPVKF